MRKEKMKKESDGKEENRRGRKGEKEAKEVSSGCQPGRSASRCNHGSGTGRYGNQPSRKKTQSGQQGQTDSVFPFLKEGGIM